MTFASPPAQRGLWRRCALASRTTSVSGWRTMTYPSRDRWTRRADRLRKPGLDNEFSQLALHRIEAVDSADSALAHAAQVHRSGRAGAVGVRTGRDDQLGPARYRSMSCAYRAST